MMRVLTPLAVLGVLFGTGLSAGGAHAADPAGVGVITAPDPAPADWEGFYAGVFGGAFVMQGDSTAPAFASDDDGNAFGGALIGYGLQFDRFVFGLEGDIGFTDTEARLGPATVGTDWIATIRGRAGVTFGDALVYGTGGIAFADSSVDLPTGQADDTLTGFTVGGGVEVELFDNFTARAEYLYSDFGTSSGTAGGAPYAYSFDGHTLRAGVTYRFN